MRPMCIFLKKIMFLLLILIGSFEAAYSQKAFLFLDIPAFLSELNAGMRSEIIVGAESTRTTYDIYYEAELELEDWMIKKLEWPQAGEGSKMIPALQEAEEKPLRMETWMVPTDIPEYISADREEELKLEDWMISRPDCLH